MKILLSKINTPLFVQSWLKVSDQVWGGKADMALLPLVKSIREVLTDYEKTLKKYQEMYIPEGADKANSATLKEFICAVEDLGSAEIDLPIEEPIKLQRKKRNESITVRDADAVSCIVDIDLSGEF